MIKELNIALVAHDARKNELINWAKFNARVLYSHNLIATGTTGKLLQKIVAERVAKGIDPYGSLYWGDDNLHVTCLLSGPLGGDAQIASMIALGQVDVLIFFCDNLSMQPHNADIQGLSRLASLYNIAFATNRTTADMILTSPLFGSDAYKPIKSDFNTYLNRSI